MSALLTFITCIAPIVCMRPHERAWHPHASQHHDVLLSACTAHPVLCAPAMEHLTQQCSPVSGVKRQGPRLVMRNHVVLTISRVVLCDGEGLRGIRHHGKRPATASCSLCCCCCGITTCL